MPRPALGYHPLCPSTLSSGRSGGAASNRIRTESTMNSWFGSVGLRHPRSSISQGCASFSAGCHQVLTLLSKAYMASRPGRDLLAAQLYRLIDSAIEPLSLPSHGLGVPP